MNIEINKKKGKMSSNTVQCRIRASRIRNVVVAFYSIILLHDVDYYIPDEY